MNFLKKVSTITEVFFVFLLGLVPLLWFRPGYMIQGSDSGYPLDYVNYFLQRTFTWATPLGFGTDWSAFMGALPLHGVQYVFSVLNVPYYDIQKATLVFWFLIISFAMYFCVRYFFPKPKHWIIRIVAVTLYSVNFYIFLFWQIGSQTTLSVYALIPLVFLFTFRFIHSEDQPIHTAIYLNLSYLLLNGGGIGGVALMGPVLAIFFGLIFLQLIFSFTKTYLLSVFKLLICSVVIYVALNAYFLLPFLSTFTQQYTSLVSERGGVEGVIEWTKSISTFTSYDNLFRLQGDNIWYTDKQEYAKAFLSNPILILLSFIFPILAYLSLIFKTGKKVKYLILVLVGFSLLGIFLSAGTHEPLGFLYIWLQKYIPGFAVFRSAYYKFMPLVIFTFAFLNGITLYYISQKIKRFPRIILPLCFVGFLLIYHFPFYDNSNFVTDNRYKTMLKVPDYVMAFVDEKPPESNDYRTLVLPPLNRGYNNDIYNWDYFSAYPIFPGVSEKSFIHNNAYLNMDERQTVERIYQLLREGELEKFYNLVRALSIKYLLITSDVVIDDDRGVRESPELYKSILSSSDNFKLIWEKGSWSQYEIIGVDINKKVFSFRDLVRYKGNTGLFPITERGNYHFLVSRQDANDVIPARRKLSTFRCLNCELNDYSLSLIQPRILPNSIFYNFKRKSETSSIIDISNTESIDANLGLSLKRLSELNSITYINDIKEVQDYFRVSDEINYYWRNISRVYASSKDAQTIEYSAKIKAYAEFQLTALRSIYNNGVVRNDKNLAESLESTISNILNIHEKVGKKLLDIYKSGAYVFALPNEPFGEDALTVIDLSSISDSDDAGVMEGFFYDNDPPSANFIEEDGRIIISNPVNSEKLTVLIPNVKADLNFKEQYIRLDYFGEEFCRVAEIKNYKWYLDYVINAEVTGSSNNLRVHIVPNASVYGESGDFNSVRTLDIGELGLRVVNMNILSNEAYKSMAVYFCGDPGRNLEETYSEINIVPVLNPIVYAEIIEAESANTSPKIEVSNINQTEYSINLTEISTPYFIGFSERYSEFWKLYATDGREIGQHFLLNGYANGWYIADDTSDRMILRFTQQEYFNNGVKVSIVTLAILLIVITWTRLKK